MIPEQTQNPLPSSASSSFSSSLFKVIMESLVTAVCAFALLLCASVSAAEGPCKFPAVFNFGDSNSDTGGLSAAFGPAPPPNGESFFGRPAGRYCDGRLVVDFIAKSLGLPYLSAYLNSLGSNFTHGANFATAGSTIRRQNTTLFQSGFSPFSLDVQFWQYSQFQTRSQDVAGNGEGVFKSLMPRELSFSEALYTFDIGQNDLTSGYFSNLTTGEVLATVPDIVQQFAGIVKDVYSHGGRYFWIHNTGPFGCLPYVLERVPHTKKQVDKAGCGIPFNRVAQNYNEKLKAAIAELREELPEAVIIYVDIYSLKYSLIRYATKYGFERPLVACCGHGGKYNHNRNIGCGTKMRVNGTEVLVGKSCENPEVRINWDGVHYTEAANHWIFNRIVDGSYSDPPTPLHTACRRKLR